MTIDTQEFLFCISIIIIFAFQLWQNRKAAKSDNTTPLIIKTYKLQRRLFIFYIFISGIMYITLESTSFELLFFLVYSLIFAIFIFEIIPLKMKIINIEQNNEGKIKYKTNKNNIKTEKNNQKKDNSSKK